MPDRGLWRHFSNASLRVSANMGCAEIAHSGLCDAVDASFERGHERRCELELFHKCLIIIKYGTDMPVTNRMQR